MSFRVAVGQSQAMDGREAGLLAARQAADQLGRSPIAFGWVIASCTFSAQQVIAGISEVLGEVPLVGFSTSATLLATTRGVPPTVEAQHRSVVIALLSGEKIQARLNWCPDFAQNTQSCTQSMLKALQPDGEQGEVLLVVADGLNGDADLLCQALSNASYTLGGCLAGGNIENGKNFQIGGLQTGSGGLTGVVLSGELVVGIGFEHGWQGVGAMARLTRVQGFSVRELDGQPVGETYTRYFGYPSYQWTATPLKDLVRIYPLGFMENNHLVVRSPLCMEEDGSLRMNSRLPQGKAVDLMVGSQEGCLQAAERAARQALEALNGAQPGLAILLVDTAWQMVMQNRSGAEVQAVRQVIGEKVPVLGGYTFGQIARLEPGGPAQLLNQHMEVILIGEKPREKD